MSQKTQEGALSNKIIYKLGSSKGGSGILIIANGVEWRQGCPYNCLSKLSY